MALRTIRVEGDPVLGKVCREVTEVTPKIVTLIDDMLETMYEANGVGLAGQVTRPNYVKARFMGEDMNEYEIEGEELLARCICHELDHLDGHLYVEKVEGALHDVTYEDTQE